MINIIKVLDRNILVVIINAIYKKRTSKIPHSRDPCSLNILMDFGGKRAGSWHHKSSGYPFIYQPRHLIDVI